MDNVLGIDGGTYLGFVVCIALLLFMVAMRAFDSKMRSSFIRLAISMLVAFAAASLDMKLAQFAEPIPLRYVAKTVKYISQGLMEYFVLKIIVRDISKKMMCWIVVPFIIMTLIVISAPFVPHVYHFTDDNRFVRDMLGNVIFIQAAVYVIIAILTCIHKWFDGYQKDALVILFMLFMVCLGVVFEESKIFPNCALESSATGSLFLYIYTYAERYNVDSVTKCYKRRCFYADAKKYSKHEMMVISMDLNDLKFINDNYGHKAGDIALLTFAEVCRSSKTNQYILYRTGGDEFMILGIRATYEDAQELVEVIKEKLQETPYACSFGIAPYKPGDDFDAIVVQADKAMYEDKSIYKASKNKRSHARTDEYDSRLVSFTNNISFLN